MRNILLMGVFFLLAASCGRVGSLAPPPDYQKPIASEDHKRGTSNRRNELLKNIAAPKRAKQKKQKSEQP